MQYLNESCPNSMGTIFIPILNWKKEVREIVSCHTISKW